MAGSAGYIQSTVRLEAEELANVDSLAAELGVTRSFLLRHLVSLGHSIVREQVETLKAAGQVFEGSGRRGQAGEGE